MIFASNQFGKISGFNYSFHNFICSKSQKSNQANAGSLINANQGQVGSWTPGGSYKPTVAAPTVWSASPGASNMGTTASTWKPSWTGGF